MDGWYKSMWKFASSNKFEIRIKEDFIDLPLLRHKDVPLMNIFIRTYKYLELKTLNYVRKFLKAYSLADITTKDGKNISHLAYTVEEGNNLRSVTWPRNPVMMHSMKNALADSSEKVLIADIALVVSPICYLATLASG